MEDRAELIEAVLDRVIPSGIGGIISSYPFGGRFIRMLKYRIDRKILFVKLKNMILCRQRES